MTGSLVFPTRLFAPPSLQVRLLGQAITGGASLSGEAQFAEVGGGGRWVADFGEACLWTREKVLAWRRFAAAADGGATSLLVPLADRRHQPLNNPYTGPDAFGLDTWVSDESDWTAAEVTAPASAAALGATALSFAYTAPKALLGGEHFSIHHATWGWRLYRVSRVVSGGTVGSAVSTSVEVRPPLREAIAASTPLNFESPRCLMRVDGDVDCTVEQLRFGNASARFVEAGGPAA